MIAFPQFWSDDLDTDLLKVFPNAIEILGPTINVPIWTISHTSFGRLNCPAQWNIPFGSFLWLKKPDLARDKNGWINIDGCTTNEPVLEGTWLEWLRDAWVHNQSWTLLPGGVTFSGVDYNRCFYPIMANIRGWEGYQDISHPRRMALIWLMKANRRFARTVEQFQIELEELPYFSTHKQLISSRKRVPSPDPQSPQPDQPVASSQPEE